MPIVSNKVTLKTRDYKDLDVSFNKHPIKKDVLTKTGNDAVAQSLRNLVLLNFYEKPFQPEIGCDVRKLLFENITPQTASTLKVLIEQTIKNFESRVSLIQTIVIPLPDENRFEVQIYYFINNSAEPVAIRFFLDRVR